MLRTTLPFGLLFALAACAQFPALDARIPPSERQAPPAPLLPLIPILESADALSASGGFEAELSARADALAARSAGLAPTSDPAEDAARLDALRQRAANLRAATPWQASTPSASLP
ncbi:hypothetical protein ruthe_01331 [Rubellimicrobium thermophilum DSM 16684]|uniref:DUF4398 domain-containing protein n=1 Tax=Rubellimicrobium thermophilum DSM 16684 TaxID=1123069 RepID=S9QYT9_9RHOB|nr:hypothetical protein [Rubellimicrobium thermophilum]EPX86516.1 hypothetical protein ruthe_01331 [Rubellimicrobium thermophilum DSM 16684]